MEDYSTRRPCGHTTPQLSGAASVLKCGWNLLLRGGCFGSGVRILLGETLNAARGINQFLFPGEEGMAAGTNFHPQGVALDGRARGEVVSTGAVHVYNVVVGVNSGFHEAPIHRVRSARQ